MFHYCSSEVEVAQGDHILYHGERHVVEMLLDAGTDLAKDYSCYFTGGLLIVGKDGGAFLLPRPEEEEDLEFVQRGL